MDTHIEQILHRPFVRPEMTLPGEDEDLPPTLHADPTDRLAAAGEEGGTTFGGIAEAGDAPPEAASDAAERVQQPAGRVSRHRNALMASAAVAVVLVAAGGVFLISPYNHVAWLGGHAAPSAPRASGQTISLPAPVAPAATLARAPTPQHAADAPRLQPVPQPKPEEVQEIVGLRSGDGAKPTAPGDARPSAPVSSPAQRLSGDPAHPTSAPSPAQASAGTPPPSAGPASVPSAPAVAPAAAPSPAQASVVVPAPAQATTRAPAAQPSLADTAPRGAAQRAARVQAAPMSTPQQVEVLNLVTELGVLVRNQRAENTQLRADVQQMRERLDTQLGDFDRRLALAEARGAINAAMGAGAPPAATPAPASGPVTPVSVTVTAPTPHPGAPVARGARPAASVTPAFSTQDAAPKRYRVQAASPGMAMLAEVDRTGDVGNLLQVNVGDDVPGYGRVKSIAQQGTAWVLTTEHGIIR